MLIHTELEAAMNQQIGNEFGASLQYVAVATLAIPLYPTFTG